MFSRNEFSEANQYKYSNEMENEQFEEEIESKNDALQVSALREEEEEANREAEEEARAVDAFKEFEKRVTLDSSLSYNLHPDQFSQDISQLDYLLIVEKNKKVKDLSVYGNYNKKAAKKEKDKRKSRANKARANLVSRKSNEIAYQLNQIEHDDKELNMHDTKNRYHAAGVMFANFAILGEWKDSNNRQCKRFRDKNSRLSSSTKERLLGLYKYATNKEKIDDVVYTLKTEVLKKRIIIHHFLPKYVSGNIEAVTDELKFLNSIKDVFGEGKIGRGILNKEEEKQVDSLIRVAATAKDMVKKSLTILNISKDDDDDTYEAYNAHSLKKERRKAEESLEQLTGELRQYDREFFKNKEVVPVPPLVENVVDDKSVLSAALIRSELVKGRHNVKRRKAGETKNLMGLVSLPFIHECRENVEKMDKIIKDGKNKDIIEKNTDTVKTLSENLRDIYRELENQSFIVESLVELEDNYPETSDKFGLYIKTREEEEEKINFIRGKIESTMNTLRYLVGDLNADELSYKQHSLLQKWYPKVVGQDYVKKVIGKKIGDINALYGSPTMENQAKEVPSDQIASVKEAISSALKDINVNLVYDDTLSELLDNIKRKKTLIEQYSKSSYVTLYKQFENIEPSANGLFKDEKEKTELCCDMRAMEQICLLYHTIRQDELMEYDPKMSLEELRSVLNNEENYIVDEAYKRQVNQEGISYKNGDERLELERSAKYNKAYMLMKGNYLKYKNSIKNCLSKKTLIANTNKIG